MHVTLLWAAQSEGVLPMNKTESAKAVRVIEETPAYWRVVFDNPPFNMIQSTSLAE